MKGWWRYPFIWLVTTVVPWLFVVGLYIGGMSGFLDNPIFAPVCAHTGYLCKPWHLSDSNILLGLEVCHHLTLVSPLFGWALARHALGKLTDRNRRGQWLLSRTIPIWSLKMCLWYLMMTIFGLVLASALSYAWIIGIKLLLWTCLFLNIGWLFWCVRDAFCVAILERRSMEAVDTAFLLRELWNVDVCVSIQEYDDYTGDLHVPAWGSVVVWRALGPIDDLVRILRDAAPGHPAAESEEVLAGAPSGRRSK